MLTLDDFASATSFYTDPISGTYKGAELVEHPPNGQGATAILMLIGGIAAIVFVVYMERAQRRITVNYAQRQGRVAYQNQATHLPLKVNMSGVIPAIFASSIVIFPSTLATWFSGSEGLGWLTDVSAALTPGNLAYTILFSGLIVFFCFFYGRFRHVEHSFIDLSIEFDLRDLDRLSRLSAEVRSGNWGKPHVAVVEADLEVELIEPVMTKFAADKGLDSPQEGGFLAPGVEMVNAPRVWHELGFAGLMSCS